MTDKAVYLDGRAIAEALGNARVANVVLLGALSALMEREGLIGSELLPDEWIVAITAAAYRANTRRAESERHSTRDAWRCDDSAQGETYSAPLSGCFPVS